MKSCHSKEVPGRLAAHLLHLSEQQQSRNLRLPVSKNQLAALLGTIPETLSRILGKMAKNGLISGTGASIIINDRQALAALAAGETKL